MPADRFPGGAGRGPERGGLAGIVAGMALAMFGLGILEATLMSLVMSSQSRALAPRRRCWAPSS
ncbi:hypothetical protein NWF32_23630 [Pseudomonas qingdaonensis]|nr:hypothetical protein [Pseudomonas qingdaonensis]